MRINILTKQFYFFEICTTKGLATWYLCYNQVRLTDKKCKNCLKLEKLLRDVLKKNINSSILVNKLLNKIIKDTETERKLF